MNRTDVNRRRHSTDTKTPAEEAKRKVEIKQCAQRRASKKKKAQLFYGTRQQPKNRRQRPESTERLFSIQTTKHKNSTRETAPTDEHSIDSRPFSFDVFVFVISTPKIIVVFFLF